MASNTTLVHVHVETALKVSSFIAKQLANGEAFETEAKAAINAQNTSALIKLILSNQDSIYAMENDADIEALFQAVFSVIYTLNDDTKDTASIISSISKATLGNKENKPRTRLSVAVTLFNLIFAGESKNEVLNDILAYSIATQQTGLVAHLFSRVDAWADAWQLSAEARRALLKNFSAVLQAEGDKALSVKALIKYIQSFKAETGSYPAEVEAQVAQALVNAVNSPVDAFADRVALLEALNVANLSAGVKPLAELLRIICDGALTDFLAFQGAAANKAALTQHKLDAASLEHNVKLLALCALAAQATDKSLTFGAIQTALQVQAEEVELWVIEAIGEKLLEASIDQITGTVTVNRYAHLSFGPAHWRNVQAKLRALRKQVAIAVDALQRNKQAPTVAMT